MKIISSPPKKTKKTTYEIHMLLLILYKIRNRGRVWTVRASTKIRGCEYSMNKDKQKMLKM